MGSSMSTAITVTLWQHRGESHHATLTENIDPAHPAATHFLGQLSHMGLSHQQSLGLVDQLLTREALTLAVNDVFWACAVLFVLLIPTLWFAKPPFGSAGGAVGH
jgi:DHA2 family multidrug resistance protein